MVFSSLVFLYRFLPAVLLLSFLCPKKYQNALLLAASLFFYAWGEPVYLPLMAATVGLCYLQGRWVAALLHRGRARAAKWALGVSVGCELALLLVFKYAAWAASLLRGAGLPVAVPHLALPIGISFYTFQALSYVVDVYRRQVPAQTNIVDLGAYIALFPQLIAGPIVRYRDIAPQLKHRTFTAAGLSGGCWRFCVGLGKKVLLANSLGPLFGRLSAADAPTVLGGWLGAVAFGLQLYFDFSGYSDMAIGLGAMFGFTFAENFRHPYLATSITQFWRRWHISLGSWFRDYLYIPLGGSRCRRARWLLNIAAVWLLTGLWHGASLNFLVWGGYFGLLLILEKLLLLPLLQRRPALGRIYTLAAVAVSWALFAFDDIGRGLHWVAAMFGLSGSALAVSADWYYLTQYGAVLLLALLCCAPPPRPLARWWARLRRCRPVGAGALQGVGCVALLLLGTAYLVGAGYNPFLYFRF